MIRETIHKDGFNNYVQIFEGTTWVFHATPSIVQLTSDELVFNVRFVNYHITDNGEYVNKDTIVSQMFVCSRQERLFS